MSLSGAMNIAVTGLKAQSQALSTISNNLANSSTIGYKGVETQFSSLVTQMYTGSNYNGAGVMSSSRQNVSAQGGIQATSNNTDLALDGNGMFMVSYGNTDSSVYFTRDGEFQTDKEGYLNNKNYYLLGWKTDDQGTIIGDKSTDNLQRINITQNASSVQPTSKATINANLNSNTPVTGVGSVKSGNITAANAADLTTVLGIDPTATFDITTTSGTVSYNLATADTDASTTLSLTEVAAAINNTVGGNVTATVSTLAGVSTLSLKPKVATDTLVGISDTSTVTAMSALGLITGNGGTTAELANPTNSSTGNTQMEVYDTLGNAHTVTMTWMKTAQTTAGSTWNIKFSSTEGTVSSSPDNVSLNFDTDGKLTTTSSTGLTLSFDWGNGSNRFQTFAVDLAGVTQVANTTTSDTTVVSQGSANTDGHSAGKLLSVSIGNDGSVVASYDNSQKVTLYKVAVATFPNYNGLAAMSNGVYEASSASGNYTLHVAGEDGSAVIEQSSLESSTVDTADEFTKMIVAQQAYSAASQVITTSKDMFQTLMSAVR